MRTPTSKTIMVRLTIISVLAALAISSPSGRAAPCTNAVDRDINHYVLFALDEMVIKQGYNISGGNVGVNGCGPLSGAGGPRLSFGTGATFVGNGLQVVSDTARITSDASIDQTFVNTIQGNPPNVPRTCGPTSFSCVDCATSNCIVSASNLVVYIASVCPDLTTFTACPSNNVTLAKDATLNLAPGCYGDVRVNDGGRLILSAGTYNLKSLSLGKNVHVLTTDSTHVNVAETIFMNDNPDIGPACHAEFCVRSDNTKISEHSIGFSHNGTIYGQFIVPNGFVDLGGNTLVTGSVFARVIRGDPGNTITNCEPVGECACIDSFTPTHGGGGDGGTIVTINGKDLLNVTQIRFSTSCDPNSGAVATILTQQSSTQMTVQLPGLFVGSYHIIAITGTGSFCSSDLFLVP